MNYPHPIIAREGWPFIAIIFLIAFVVQISAGFGLAWPLWLLTIFVCQFFRDPPRVIPNESNVILSPADGRIVAVEKSYDPYGNRDSLKISVFMNVFNVHSQRAPVDGKVRLIEYHRGNFLNAELAKASLENERNALLIDTPNQHLISCVQIAGLVARRILCYVKAGENLAKGERYGFIRFGSRVDIYLPLGSSSRVAIGEKVYASTTILADLPAENSNKILELNETYS